MQTTRYWQVLLQEKIPKEYDYLIKADTYRSIDYDISGTNLRQFLEAIVGMMLEYEKIILNREQIQNVGLAKGIEKLEYHEAINKDLKKELHKIRKIANEGPHPFSNIKKDELEKIFSLSKEVAEYFTKNYMDKIISEKNKSLNETELPEIQENEIYIFECLKPECRREIKDRNNLKVCKKCGGPVKFKNIDANYIPDEVEPVSPYVGVPTLTRPTETNEITIKQSVDILMEKPKIIKKHKIEIYDSSLQVIEEVVLNKENIVVGRSSSRSTEIPDIDLVDVANDENGNCLISREHVHITKIEDDYYVKNASSKALVQINHEKLEYNQNNVKLNNNDIIILNNFIALLYRVV